MSLETGGVKYTHLYHGIVKLRPIPEKEKEFGKYDVGCAYLLVCLAAGAETDGSNINLTQKHLAETCFCSEIEIRKRLKILRDYGYIEKALDETGKVRKNGRTVIYNLTLPGVHDVVVQKRLLTLVPSSAPKNDPLAGLDLIDDLLDYGPFVGIEEEKIQPIINTMSNEEYEEYERKYKEIAQSIVNGLINGLALEAYSKVAQSWNINLNGCLLEAQEEKKKKRLMAK